MCFHSVLVLLFAAADFSGGYTVLPFAPLHAYNKVQAQEGAPEQER